MSNSNLTTQKPLVSKDMTVGEMVGKYPKTVNIMLSHGLHCIGCSANPYETIENGALGHGMSQEDVASLIEQLNKVAAEPARPKTGIFLTEAAVTKVNELRIAEKKEGQNLKIKVTPQGCDGWDYFMDFAPKAENDEKEIELAGMKVFIAPDSEKALQGAEIDYLVTNEGEGFKIDNPNKPEGCNCGGGCK